MAHILIIEDDKAIQNLLKIALKQEGHTVDIVNNASSGINFATRNVVDIILLDLGLPDMDGINVVEAVRSFSNNLPIVVVSARDDEQEKVKCLDSGVNDYVQKPFSTIELMARIRAVLRNSTTAAESLDSIFVNGNLTIDYLAHTVMVDGGEVHFTNYEYKVLCVLAKNIGKTLTHNFIISKVWGVGGNDASGLRVFMAGIRRKVEQDPYKQELIRTEVGVGYKMIRLTE